MTEPRVEAGDRALDPWEHIPAQYKTDRWAFDYDEKNSTFFVHSGGHRICDAEDSEVANAICLAFNRESAMNAQERELDQLLPDSLNRPMSERIQGLKERADREAKLAVNLAYRLQKLVDRLKVVMSWPDRHFNNDLAIEIAVELAEAERLLAERREAK